LLLIVKIASGVKVSQWVDIKGKHDHTSPWHEIYGVGGSNYLRFFSFLNLNDFIFA
jgi:hypothetical protein